MKLFEELYVDLRDLENIGRFDCSRADRIDAIEAVVKGCPNSFDSMLTISGRENDVLIFGDVFDYVLTKGQALLALGCTQVDQGIYNYRGVGYNV